MRFVAERMKEPSTWRGLALFVSGLGIYISPEQWEVIAAFGMGLSGLIGMTTKDTKAE